MDWYSWHQKYEKSPALQARLDRVRNQIACAINDYRDEIINLVSICAGDGRDVTGTLATHPRKDYVTATLIESNQSLIRQGMDASSTLNLQNRVRFLCADATQSNTYKEIVPASVLVVCGVFGNIQSIRLEQLILSFRQLCREQAYVVWTRRLNNDDDNKVLIKIMSWFARAGFEEVVAEKTAPPGFIVVTHKYTGSTMPLEPDMTLFEFTGYDRM